MIVVAAIYLASIIAFATGIAASPNHTFRGWPAVITFLAMLVSGAILAVATI